MKGFIDHSPKAVIELNMEELYLLHIILGYHIEYANEHTEKVKMQDKLNDLVSNLYSTMVRVS